MAGDEFNEFNITPPPPKKITTTTPSLNVTCLIDLYVGTSPILYMP
jgi:hypothetical protein